VKSADEQNSPVKTKAVPIDPGSMTVLWMNESASEDVLDMVSDSVPGVSIDQAVPLAKTLGVLEALRAVANTGIAEHLRADLVSTARGSVAIAASIYRLPDGKLLLLMEHTWQVRHGKTGESASRRSGRRAR
jgi:hypothetical protein